MPYCPCACVWGACFVLGRIGDLASGSAFVLGCFDLQIRCVWHRRGALVADLLLSGSSLRAPGHGLRYLATPPEVWPPSLGRRLAVSVICKLASRGGPSNLKQRKVLNKTTGLTVKVIPPRSSRLASWRCDCTTSRAFHALFSVTHVIIG